MKKLILAGAAAATLGVAAPAQAAAPTTCQGYAVTVLNSSINPWDKCAGFYDANIFSSSPGDVILQKEGVAFLGGTFDGNFGALFGFGSLGDDSNGARTVQFGKTFYGTTIIGMHFGNIGLADKKTDYGNVSAFYRFDFGDAGASSLTFVESRGLSNLWVYSSENPPAVPEPATWALLILGFGAVGGALRASRKQRVALRYA